MLNKRWIRLLVSLAILIALGWFFRDELDFIGEGLRRLEHAQPLAIIAVIIASSGAIFAMSEVMRWLMRAGGLDVPPTETAAITLASNAWSTTLPAGPAFSAVLTFHVQRSWGATVALGGWFLVVSSAISTLWLVIIGLGAVLFLNADMALWSLLATLLAMVALTATLFWITNNPRTIENWVRRLSFVRGEKQEGIVTQIRNLDEVHLSRWQFAVVSFHSLANRLLDMLSLWACVWAVTDNLPALNADADHAPIAGVALAYITAKLAGSAQVTPAGLGTVEAAIIATLVATGLTAVDATSAAIIYRLISFALMTIIGWVVYFWHYARRGITYAALNRTRSSTPA